MTLTTSYEIAKNLFLVRQELSQGTTAPAKPQATNHIAVIDCSGSMAGDLPRIREQLKKRLPQLLAEGDTFSLIWFSGRGEFGALIEAEPVATLKDLQDVNKAVDRWLKPIGLTGFKEPLAEVGALVGRVSKKNGNPFALFFMSDGCDNQWDRASILKTIEGVAGKLASSTFVEYGYYADRPLLAAMAEKCGGSLIFAESFDDYMPKFEAKMQQRAIGEKRIEVTVGGDPIGGFAFALDDAKHEITTYEASTGKAVVPESTRTIWYLAPSQIGQPVKLPMSTPQGINPPGGGAQHKLACNSPFGGAAYAALSLFAVRMKPDVVYPILKALGDVAFIELFAGCFGKQKYTEFMQTARTAAFFADVRLTKGYDPSKVPNDDAFTVLDLLRVLSEDDATRLLLDHSAFSYDRISRARVDADENFSAEEQAKLDELRGKLAKTKKPKEVQQLNDEIAHLIANKREALKFEATPVLDGYEISNLTYNESRANISVLVRKTGTVDLSKRDVPSGVPATFETKIWRNYSIVVDGLVNVDKLPVRVSKATLDTLSKHGVEHTVGAGPLPSESPQLYDIVIDVKPLPVINRSMVKACSAASLIELQLKLTEAKAHQKVFNAYVKELFPEAKIAGSAIAAKYGADAATWLKEQGITDGGFAPKSVQAESKDFYVAKEVEIKLKGYGSLPKVEDAKAGKGGGGGAFMKAAIDEVETFIKMSAKGLHKAWLTGKQQVAVAQARALMHQMAQAKFAIIVGQVWPTEFKSIDENTLTVKVGGKDVTGSIVMTDLQVNI